MLYELSESQVKNITVFLQRVDLKGSEAISLVSILQSLSNPQIKSEKNNEVKAKYKDTGASGATSFAGRKGVN